MRRLYFFILPFISAGLASPAAVMAVEGNLCLPSESVVFSCTTHTRVASICAHQTTLQYRFGRKDNIELSYPDLNAPKDSSFLAGNMMFSGGGGMWIRFQKGAFRYTVFDATGKWGPRGRIAGASGIAVAKDGKEVANIPCSGGAGFNSTAADLARLGIQSDPDDFDIPDAFLPVESRGSQ